MRVTILGGSGGCGRELVKQAAARGHEVRTLVRDSSKIDPPAGVELVRGDLCDSSFLREGVRGADVVLSALGLRLNGIAPWSKAEQPDFLDRNTPALIAAMQAEGVSRLIAISAGGVGESRAQMPAAFRWFISMSALKIAYAALDRMEKTMLDSSLDVLICRPTGLTDEPATGQVQVASGFSGRATIPRADVAGWMLDQLEVERFDQRTPMITVTGAKAAAA